MTLEEVEQYLSVRHTVLDKNIKDEIVSKKDAAIEIKNEILANYLWCLLQIYNIQNGFLSAFNYLQRKKYIDAWLTLDRIDLSIGNLNDNFDITVEDDKYNIVFISKILKEYQKLFPYRYFLSREAIIKDEECSICGKKISLRRQCEHQKGKLYMGELCCHIVKDIEFKGVALVTDPFDRYAFLQLEDQEYNYSMLDMLMEAIHSPYDSFYITIYKIKNPKFKNIGRNEKCPCGSGKKYKKCHLGTKEELIDHYRINIQGKNEGDLIPLKYIYC